MTRTDTSFTPGWPWPEVEELKSPAGPVWPSLTRIWLARGNLRQRHRPARIGETALSDTTCGDAEGSPADARRGRRWLPCRW